MPPSSVARYFGPCTNANAPGSAQLLDAFPLLRSQDLSQARECIGRVLSPHLLELCGDARTLDVSHNQIRLRELTVNALRDGAEVLIDPGERGDFYLVQLPLAGPWRRRPCVSHAPLPRGGNFGDLIMLAPFSIEGASSKSGALQAARPGGKLSKAS